MDNADLFREIIDGNLNSLSLLVIEAGLEGATPDQLLKAPPLHLYAAVIERFWRGERAWLEALLKPLRQMNGTDPEWPLIRLATSLRLQLLTREIDEADFQTARENACSDSRWAGEFCILVAAIHEQREEKALSRDWYQRAIPALVRIGARRKSVRAALNVVAIESHLDTCRNLIPRYHDIYRQAIRRDIRETTVAGICLLNISRDYQQLGASGIALRYARHSLKLLEQDFGILPHYLAMVHRCNLLLELGRIDEARLDYEQARAAPFPEVIGALTLLENVFKPERLVGLTKSVTPLQPSWEERKRDWIAHGGFEPKAKLSRLEQRLIQLLSSGPMQRQALMDRLYGERLQVHVRMNRFQSMLSTLRKKVPGIVVYEGDFYRLADPLFPAAGTADLA